MIVLGEPFTKRCTIPFGLETLGFPTTSADKMTVDVDPSHIIFLDNEVHSAWLSAYQTRITWTREMPADVEAQLRFRFRIQNAGSEVAGGHQRLRLEMMILPRGTSLESFTGEARLTINDANFPSIPVFIRSNPVVWDNDGKKHQHHSFCTPLFQCGAAEENRWNAVIEEDEEGVDPIKPKLTDELHRRLLWETEQKFAAGFSAKHIAKNQQSFIRNLIRDPNHYIPYSTPPLYLAALESQESDSHWSEVGDSSDSQVDQAVYEEQEEAEETASGGGASQNMRRAGSNSEDWMHDEEFEEMMRINLDSNSSRGSVRGNDEAAGGSSSLPPPRTDNGGQSGGGVRRSQRVRAEAGRSQESADDSLANFAGLSSNPATGEQNYIESQAPLAGVSHYNAVPERTNGDHHLAEKGKKPLLKAKMRLGSRFSDKIPILPATLSALAGDHPRANMDDLIHIHDWMASSLARSSKKSVASSANAFDRVMGNSRDWLHNPLPGDQEVIFSRLLRLTSISRATALQYMKNYNTNLVLAGKVPPPETATFIRMKRGVRKEMTDPIKNVAEDHRMAYNMDSLELAVGAFQKMRDLGLWTAEKALIHKTLLLTCFWGRFRTGEVTVPAQCHIIMEDTVMALDVDIIEDEKKADGGVESFLRIWLRREKANAHRAGSLVEISKLPSSLAHVCPFRAMKKYLQVARAYGLTRFDPVFTEPDGSAMTPAKFASGVELAIKTALPATGAKLFKVLKNHSTRSAVPTLCQELAHFIPPQIVQHLGRWQSDCYQLYMKDYSSALAARRFVEEEIIAKIAERKEQEAGRTNFFRANN